MNYKTYINLDDGGVFVKGHKSYLQKKGIPVDEVVEVFAGDGTLGKELELPEDQNISDLLTYTYYEHIDPVNTNWYDAPNGVVRESAYETVIRFGAEEDRTISLLIMAAPPEVDATEVEMKNETYHCGAYEAAKALYHLFDGSKLLYIGEINSNRFGSGKFFRHLEEIDEYEFEKLVSSKYDYENGYFTDTQYFDEPIGIHPYLLRFHPCKDEDCDCRDDFQIQNDLRSYTDRYL